MSHEQLHLLQHKAPWLNVPGFFSGRRSTSRSGWWCSCSAAGRSGGTGKEASSLPGACAACGSGALPFFGLSITFAAFDWLMSVDPSGSPPSSASTTSRAASSPASRCSPSSPSSAATSSGSGGLVTRHHTHNLGKLMLAFTAFWTYIAFSQFMLIWIASCPRRCLVRGSG